MSRMFVDRKFELEFLNERWKNRNFEFIVLYGRRRIGKTEIIKQFIKDKSHLYFLCDKKGTEENIRRFKREVAKYLGEPEIATNDLEEIFEYLVNRVKKRIAIVFDEFSYLVEKDSAIPSVFQRAIDNVLQNSNVFLILCGSSMSMMESGILSYKSPLYGRKTGHLKVKNLPFRSYFDFYPGNPLEKNIEFHSILGGVPFYMEKFSPEKSTFENVRDEIANRKGRLFEEVEFLLKEEFREPETYKRIIEAIAFGNTKLVQIANYSNIQPNQLTKYLQSLINLGIITKEKIVTEKKPKSKKIIYSIKDNFFDFYFSFIEPFKSDLEIDELKNFKEYFFGNFNQFVGRKFETIIREEIINHIFSSDFTKIGKWWHKDKEIDIVALNEKTKEILFGECKWKDRVNASKIAKELANKAEYVQWHNERRKEKFAIFAKSFSRKIEEYEGRKVYCFDLRDLGRVLLE